MKQRIAKLRNKTKMIAGGLFLAVLMAVNLQVGMNDGSTTDISLLGLEASVFASAAVATATSCNDMVCGAELVCGGWWIFETCYTTCAHGGSGYTNCEPGTNCTTKTCGIW